MEAFIGASSPLFVYSPCRGCSDTSGFVFDQQAQGYTTRSSEPLRIALNFTGTSASFHLTKPLSSSFRTRIITNGTAPSTSQEELVTANSTSSTSIHSLPKGLHQVELQINQEPLSETLDDYLTFQGVSLGQGTILSATTSNQTIDDTAWANGTVTLSPGWNMLEQNNSNWINTTEFDQERSTAGSNYNESISWTTLGGASTSIVFSGGTVWAYGLVGPEHGLYEVTLDDQVQGVFDATAASRLYDQVLYYSTGLSYQLHNLTLTNLVEGRRLSFDRLVSTSGANDIANIIPDSTPISASAPGLSSATATHAAATIAGSSVPRATIIGVSIAAAVLVTALVAWAVVIFAGVREKRKRQDRSDGRRDEIQAVKAKSNFLRFSVNSKKQPTFQMLSDPTLSAAPATSHERTGSGPSFLSLTRLTSKPRAAAVAQPTPVRYNGMNISPPAMSPALEAALGGRTHSPLTQLKHANLAASGKQTTPVKMGERKLETPFLSMSGGGDATSQRVELGSASPSVTLGTSVIPNLEDRSPRRRFFGRAADADKRGSGSSYGSAKTGNSVGSGWRYM